MLDKQTSLPLYQQLAETIKADIINGKYTAGSKIPSENDLARIYDVSRVTVRGALDALYDEGLINKVHGKGTFVSSKRISRNIAKGISFSDMIRLNGMTPSSRIIKCAYEPANEADIRELGLEPDSEIIVLERLRLADNVPVSIDTVRMHPRASFIMNYDLTKSSMIAALRENGIMTSTPDRIVRLVYASKDAARYLGIEQGYPLLSIYHITFDQNGVPLDRTTQLIIGDRIEFHTQ